MQELLKWERRATLINTTLYVALPKDWARKNKIGRYSDIDLKLMEDGSLRLTPGEQNND